MGQIGGGGATRRWAPGKKRLKGGKNRLGATSANLPRVFEFPFYFSKLTTIRRTGPELATALPNVPAQQAPRLPLFPPVVIACARMSAPSLAFAIAPTPGPAAPAAKRAADARAERPGSDFATALDAETAPEAPSAPTQPRSEKAASETQPADETAVDAETDVAAEAPAAVVVPPPAAPILPLAAASEAAPEIDAAKASDIVPPALPELDAEAEPAEQTPPSAEAAKTTAAHAAIAAAAPAPAALPAVAPRAAKPVVDVALEPVAEPSAEADAPPPPATGSAPLPPEAPRLRDVIDRAQAARTEAAAAPASSEGDAAPADNAPVQAAADKSALASPAAASRPAPTVAEPAAPAPLAAEPEAAAPALQTAEAARIEARAAEAATLALSTVSHAAIETTAQIAAQIIKKLDARSTRFEMALTPEDLGRVDVSLDIDADGQLAARLAFDNPVAAADLRGRVDELRRQLQDAGFTLADDALSFTERDPSAGQHGFEGGAFDRGHDPRNARAFGAASRLTADADLAAAPARWIPLALTPDRVDMKV